MNHSIESEKAVLGSMLSSNRAYEQAITKLKDSDFYLESSQIIFKTIINITIQSGGELCDTPNLISELAKNKLLDICGGQFHIHEISEDSFVIPNITHHISMIKFYSEKRNTLNSITESLKIAKDSEDMNGLKISQSTILGMVIDRHDNAVKVKKSTHDSIIDTADLPKGIPWPGHWDLKKYRHRGKPNLLAGFAGAGKTRTSINLVLDDMLNERYTLYISCEMTTGEIKTMLLAMFIYRETSESNHMWSMAKLYKGNPDQYKPIIEMIDKYVTVIDGNRYTYLDAERDFYAYQVRHGFFPDSFFIDYIQKLLHEDLRLDKYRSVTDNMNRLTALVKNTPSALTLPAQTNRTGQKDSDQAPSLHDLKNSGALEEDCALVVTFARPAKFDANILEYYFPKDRYGSKIDRTLFRYDGKTGYVLGQDDQIQGREIEYKYK